MSARAFALLAFVLGSSCACGDRGFHVESASGPLLDGCARVAGTAAERSRGLIGHASLAAGEALWLEWPSPVEACIHNAGVRFAIDELFVDEHGSVVAIERMVPAQDASSRCHTGVRHVIELPASAAAAVTVGAVVRW